MSHRTPLYLLLLCPWVVACSEPEPETPKVSGEYASVGETAEVEGLEPLELTYVDVTAEAGIDFVHDTGAFGEKYLPETMGGGGGFFDYDGDGDPDLLLLNGDLWPGHEDRERPRWKLYRNDGDWRFTDVTDEAGLAQPFYAMGMTAADFDADGDADLFVGGVGGYRYFVNEGGRFVERSAELGLEPGTWTDDEGNEHGPFATSSGAFDADGDGDLDLFVCHYVHWSPQTDVYATMDGKTKSYATPKQYAGESCRLWINDGSGRFSDGTDAAGMRNDQGKSLGVSFVDVDDDGDLDVVVANDTQPDYLYLNAGDGTFEEVGVKAGIALDANARARAGMGVDCAVLELTGKATVAVGNFSGEAVALWENRGRIFVDRAAQYGVAESTLQPLTFGVRFFDADLDGFVDLVLANGHIEPTIGDVHESLSYAQPTQLLRGSGRDFRPVETEVGEALVVPRVARGLATADVDGDGDLDVFLGVNGGRPVLLRADRPGAGERSLTVRVVGDGSNREALGARIEVRQGERRQVRWVTTGGSYLSQSEVSRVFGLGADASPVEVTVRWPDGREQTFTDVGPGTLVASP